MEISPVEIDEGPRPLRDEIVSPTIHEFHAKIAREFLRLYGPRRLVSFIQRCQYSGPWRESVETLMGKKNRKYETVSKLEYELIALSKLKEGGKATKEQSARLDQLLITTSPKFTDMNDNDLSAVCEEYISKLGLPS